MIEQDKNNTESITTDRCRLIELFHHYRTKMKLTKINVVLKGFLGPKNVPDFSKVAKTILKDLTSNKSTKNLIDEVDRNFLLKETPNIHIVNSNNMWENLKRHKLRKGPKKPKKEKLRRVYKNDY
ncbi:hypothetical protein HZS_7207 [Henneguya salminicola]|nr:hypothetical protein HZS_7207 [Henneguya salminicola]